MEPQVSQHFGEYCQVTGGGMTEPGLQADSPACRSLTGRAGPVGSVVVVAAESVVVHPCQVRGVRVAGEG
jgi:hypothetical protein